MTNNKHHFSTNLNRFVGILKAIKRDLPTKNYEIKGFYGENPVSKLKPQSFCTKLREAYNEAVELGIEFPCEVSFRWSANSVTAFPTGQSPELDPLVIGPKDDTIEASPRDFQDIVEIVKLCNKDVFKHPIEIQGEAPLELRGFAEFTQLEKSYLIH